MKKITLLIFLMALPFFGTAQTFNFENSDDGWDGLGGFIPTTGATFYLLTTKDGDGSLKNPSVANASTGVDTSVNSFVGITIRNNNANGPDFLRVSYPKVGSGRIYVNMDITTGDTEFVTYWFDLSNGTNWVGTRDDIKLHFKAAGNTDYILPDAGSNASIAIDKIEFAATPPTTEKSDYTFEVDGDFEGWTEKNMDPDGTVSGGIYTVTPKADKFAQIIQEAHYIDADNNGSFHIILKNESANDLLRIVVDGSDVAVISISINDTEENEYHFDLTKLSGGWTGHYNGFKITFADSSNTNPAQSSATGSLLIQSIIFDNEAILATDDVDFKDDVNISLYPNPVSELMNIHSPQIVEKVDVYNLLGQLEMSKKGNVKELNISRLSTGMYFVKIHQEDSVISTKRFIKE